MPRNRIAETLSGASPPEPSQVPNAHVNNSDDDSKQTSFNTVLERAESVKTSLRNAHTQVNELVAALKQHRRQSKLMKSTLASLRQLQAMQV